MNGILKGFNGLRIPHCHFLLIHGYPLSAFVLNNGCSSDNWQCHRDRSDTSYPRPAGALWYLDHRWRPNLLDCRTKAYDTNFTVPEQERKGAIHTPTMHLLLAITIGCWALQCSNSTWKSKPKRQKTNLLGVSSQSFHGMKCEESLPGWFNPCTTTPLPDGLWAPNTWHWRSCFLTVVLVMLDGYPHWLVHHLSLRWSFDVAKTEN